MLSQEKVLTRSAVKMETVHDIKQLLVIGYLREIVPDSITSPTFKRVTSDDGADVIDGTPSLMAMNSPSFGTMCRDENCQFLLLEKCSFCFKAFKLNYKN